MADAPQTSTVRDALAVVGAFDALLRPGRAGRPLDPGEACDQVADVIRHARMLRSHQVDDVVEHLESRAEAEQRRSQDEAEGLTADAEIERLGRALAEEGHGDPLGGEGAVDTALRLLRAANPPDPGEELPDPPTPRDARAREEVDRLVERVRGPDS